MDNGIKKKNGDKFEKEVMVALDKAGILYTDQPENAPEHVSYCVRPDLLVGNTWVFCQQALKGGGLQNDRLEHVYQMSTNQVWEKGEVFYALKDATPTNESTREKNKEKRAAFNKLLKMKMIGTKEDLVEMINASNVSKD